MQYECINLEDYIQTGEGGTSISGTSSRTLVAKMVFLISKIHDGKGSYGEYLQGMIDTYLPERKDF